MSQFVIMTDAQIEIGPCTDTTLPVMAPQQADTPSRSSETLKACISAAKVAIPILQQNP